MQRYRVTVPPGVGPGMAFVVSVNGQQMKVTCPPNIRPGMQLDIQAPAQQQQSIPTASYAAAPPPPPPPQHRHGDPAHMGPVALGQQCAASQHAEQQLRATQGKPDPSLIFTAMDRDGSNSVSVDELQFGLSNGGRMTFSKKTCELLVNLYDRNRDNGLSRDEFIQLWGYLDQWRAVFDAHDKDKSGVLSKSELEGSINQVGYRFSPEFYEKLRRIYNTSQHGGGIAFDGFIQLFCELHALTEAFKTKDTQRVGRAEFGYEEFLNAAFTLHTN